ncbi:MAG: hypothetical protein E5V49_05065 [Mesorhizobium sp.]|nr:hypothetical protein EN848_20740 [bacterium M00.F.Ca.ET.205.01.1.1]TGU50706.1 hypothetical protein EN795_20290 [bacterium M00.F.Ca.ET.152.01.1.1]TGV34199.1 hypothetical protein EN829_018240 [Mesorhizobium sp. M00.F.Ca.ET.186.01.1.1]TGZ42137.1 hypothetical protein EN805_17810 [bacterium M00.F.Ca.ET.162.01.1.1]TJW33935.1 MAG: hypothetical protein E5V49_05065 [Mesorhizobium sp.]
MTKLQAALSAIRAIAAIDFQTHPNSVISLDLTGIIAFDAVREWEAARRFAMRGSGNGPGWEAAFTREKRSGFA